MLLGQCEHVRRRHIAGDEEHGVVGAVIAAEEGAGVLVERRHDGDVALVAQRRVAVRMALERGADELLVERELGLRARLAILAVDGAGLGLERGFGVRQALKPIALELHDLLEILGRHRQVIGRVVVGRIGVRVGADRRDDAAVDVGRETLRAAEHHVLEEVREAGAAGLVLVARARAHDRPVRHEAVARHRHDDDVEAVRQRPSRRREGDDGRHRWNYSTRRRASATC